MVIIVQLEIQRAVHLAQLPKLEKAGDPWLCSQQHDYSVIVLRLP